MGVSIVRQNGGFFSVPYVSSKDILEDYPPRALNPYFFRTKLQPLTFTLTFSCETDDINIAKLNAISTWLCQSTYKPFISEDNPNKVYYIMATNQIDFMTNGVEQGYFEIEFRCQHPYALTLAATPSYESIYDYDDPSETQFTIHNDYSVDAFGPVFMGYMNLNRIPVKFNRCSSDFDCSNNVLTTLENSPKTVHGNFNCSNNELINLKEGPEFVSMSYNCSHNLLESLEGSPAKLKNFNCSDNFLKNLDYAPIVSGNFIKNDNLLK